MKSKILTLLLIFLGCCYSNLYAQGCPAETGTPNPAPAVLDVCSDETVTYAIPDNTYGTTLPNNAFIVETTIGGTTSLIINENATSYTFDPAALGMSAGDQACVVGATYDQQQINDLIETLSNGFICGIAGLDDATCQAIADLNAMGGISSLQGALDFAATLGVPAPTTIAEANQLLVDLNVQADLLGGVCYGLSTPAGAADFCWNVIDCPTVCDPLVSTTTAPPAVVTSESTCEADNVTLSGGVIAAPATACPDGSTLEYSIDAGATWSTTLPAYDQVMAITVETRCVCDTDATDISTTASVTTAPGMCPNCDAVAAATAPPAVVTSESTCEVDNVTLSGGVIDPPTMGCPTGSTLEYSTDGGATWSATLPTYDQMTAVTVDTRCLCDLDGTTASATASATTVPGTCPTCADIVAAAAPAAVVSSESTCEADGVTLSGGVIDAPATACPASSTLEYSIDGGATWSATLPTYDQMTAVTVDTRCLCDLDGTTASPTASVTTVPGMCAVVECGITAGEPAMPTATVCNTELTSVDVTMIFGDPGPAGTPSLVQNYAVTDPATGDLITISNTATLDLSSVAVGGMACVQAIAYTQETLDAITAAVDNVTQFPGSPVPAFGMLDLSGFLNGLNGVFEAVGFEFTAADIQMWCETQMLTIPFSQLPGGLIPDLTLDLMTLIPPSGFCCDFSDSDYCLTVENCLDPCDPACENDLYIQIESIEIVDPGQVVGTVNPFDNPTGCAGIASLDGVDGFIEVDIVVNGFALPQISVDGGTAGTTTGPWGGFISLGVAACGESTVNSSVSVSDDDSAVTGGNDDLTDSATEDFSITGGTFTACGGNIIITYSANCIVDCAACNTACDPLVSTITAPPAVVSSESTCQADGVTLAGGAIAAPATACPTGSTLEYSTDGGATWSTTLPTYDQMTAVTVDTRCVCDADATDVSTTASVTTVPGMCAAMCDPAIAAATAPAAVVTSESTCPDGMTLSGGVIGAPTGTCPAGSTLEYSTDGGASWSTTLPMYDQMTAVTVDTRCLCDLDGTTASATSSVTTVPGTCPVAPVCAISVAISNFACDDGGTPDDPADDMVTFDYTVSDNNAGGNTSATTWSSDQGDAGAAYGTTVSVGPVMADGSTWSINVTDDGDATCMASASQVLSDCATVENIPTVGEWGLIMLGLLMTITAVVGIRQRREEEVYG